MPSQARIIIPKVVVIQTTNFVMVLSGKRALKAILAVPTARLKKTGNRLAINRGIAIR